MSKSLEHRASRIEDDFSDDHLSLEEDVEVDPNNPILKYCHWRIDTVKGKPFRWFLPMCDGGAWDGPRSCTCRSRRINKKAKTEDLIFEIESLKRRVAVLEKYTKSIMGIQPLEEPHDH